jgi:hypothetical protein
MRSPAIADILGRADELGLPDWYLGAGCIAQTVWNSLTGKPPLHGIHDFDIAYFDPVDITAETEQAVAEAARALLPQRIDVKNQARVHVWYEERFGPRLAPYASAEQAISTWPTTATSVGVRPADSRLLVCAPYGLSDLFAMVVRPNKALVSEDVYRSKVDRWKSFWPELTIVDW